MIVLHIISGLTNGGAESQLAQLVANDSSNEHHVFSMMDVGFFGKPILDAGVPLIEGHMPKGKLNVSGMKLLFRTIRTLKPDVIQTWMYHADVIGGVLGVLCGQRNVVWGIHHTSHDKEQTSKSIRAIVKLSAILSRFIPASIICCASTTRDLHIEAGYSKKKLKVVFNGYNQDRFYASAEQRSTFRADNNISDSEFVIGMVGRWNPQKDHRNLIAALERLESSGYEQWRCLMVGPDVDDNNAELVGWLKEAKLSHRVSLLGSRRDIEAIMSAMDVLTLPSAFGEAFPNVVAEAMLTERPCIVTDVGDSADMVGEHGWVVPPRDSEQLYICLKEAIREFEAGNTWLERGRLSRERIIQNYGLSRMIETYTEIWQDGL